MVFACHQCCLEGAKNRLNVTHYLLGPCMHTFVLGPEQLPALGFSCSSYSHSPPMEVGVGRSPEESVK